MPILFALTLLLLLLLLLPPLLPGRIFIRYGENVAEEMPIFFALIQACTADGQFPTTPEARALPPLGGN
jgi:hypothetical protein